MIKKIILSVVIIAVTFLVAICGYFFVIDIESNVPKNESTYTDIDMSKYMSRNIFTITPKGESPLKTILYFHGGAYAGEMTEYHWSFLQKLSYDTNAKIIIPDYPLSPKYTYKDVLTMTKSFYNDIVSKDGLIIMGDSAGGGLALGLEETLSLNNKQLPAKTILISPWLDTSMTNPKIDEIQPRDKVLNKFKLSIAGILYSRGITDNEKYFVNPLYGDITKLNDLSIYTGTNDILNPDSHLLYERFQSLGKSADLREYNGASHIWIINDNDYLADKAYTDLLNDIEIQK